MRKRTTAFLKTGHVIRGACYAVILLVVTLLSFFRPEAPAKLSHRTISFAQRVAYQRAIEEVYWRHRIWPEGRRDPKPSLDAVMSQAQLEKKVADYLRKSQALEDYWHRPITPNELQTEMDRWRKIRSSPRSCRNFLKHWKMIHLSSLSAWSGRCSWSEHLRTLSQL